MDFQEDFEVLYEDNHLIAVSKKAGILVQGDETGDEPLSELVKDYIRVKYDKPGNVFTGVIHRLDRPVSGLVLLAKTSKALERMNELWREKEVKKTYVAVVGHKPPKSYDELTHWLVKDSSKNKTSAYTSNKKNGQKAELSYTLISAINDDYLLKINPLTGRPHQIRAQLAQIGCAIQGDKKYGSGKFSPDGSIALHSYGLEFIHPVKKEKIQLKAKLPSNSWWNKFREIHVDLE